ncbi:SHOCT domain-containing protein [Streptomyces sp. A3M-1-3]|uniref:SHOCT domain-containing protein n=1 Tax=Streptomyces sp. A3M-1-3 TaxID=2962044 RepID=UPI0020B6D006|nr:SHOCT domain-containing protein [Streptomyces sp. A3M-1-3]MCP3820251.1 SHOCT domain-containing protein [Streptomyces sp. A3M-1-3]
MAMYGSMNGMMSGMGAWMLLWGLVGLVFLALVILGLVWLARLLIRNTAGDNTTGRPAGAEAPQDILRRRYAAGDIDEDEFLRRMSGLGQR